MVESHNMDSPVTPEDHPAANASKHKALHQDGKRTKAATDGKVDNGKLGGVLKFTKNPGFLKSRVEFFDKLLKAQDEKYA
jgi:hypothetical protein